MAVIRQCLLCRPLYKIFPSCKHLLIASITTSPRSFSRAWACSLPPSTRASTSPAHVEQNGPETDGSSKVRALTQKLEVLGINCDDFVMPGRYHRLFCPKCKGGQSMLIAYFGERMISAKTLRRNVVMQMSSDKNVIAFTYRQNGLLVGCKYRTVGKRFWQEKGTEKRLYGLDDINDVPEIIIVEGEIDKLSLEEAGFCNCVSVPGGAPGKVSTKELPSFEKFTFLEEYLAG